MGRIMITCKQAHQLVSERLDHDLKTGESLRLRLHLSMCSGCTNFCRQMTLLRNAMRQYPLRDMDGDTENKNANDTK